MHFGARSINKTSDGGYIITGWTFSYGPGAVGNVWLVKTDSLGNMQWNKFFGGSDVDRGLSVQQTLDGGYILTGYTASSGTGLDDMLLIKTDSAGNAQWQYTFGGTGRDYGNSVIQSSDGGFVVTSYTLSYGAGGDDLWIVKTNESGNMLWSKTLGGAQSDVGNYIIQTTDGSYVITGHTLSSGAGLHDVWLIKLNSWIPVELNSFTASIMESSVKLNWTTATETNNKGFEIQRREISNNQLSEWISLGFVNGKGTSTDINHYSFTDEYLTNGVYHYRLKQIDYDGSFTYSDFVEAQITSPDEFVLYQNYPNPFNPSTKIKYTIPTTPASLPLLTKEGIEGRFVTLKVYDLLGREVATLVNEEQTAGNYEVEFNIARGTNRAITSGIYFYQLKVYNSSTGSGQSIIQTKKMILLE